MAFFLQTDPSVIQFRCWTVGRTGPATKERGFSLVELSVVIVIIAVMAALGMPALARELRDRRVRQVAEEVATLYRDARLRAVGRGAAVLVTYSKAARAFAVREAVRGGPASCARLPSPSCTETLWASPATTVGGSQELSSYGLDATGTEVTGLKVQVDAPDASAEDISGLAVCFTPMGRAFVNYSGDTSALAPMTGVSLARIYRTVPGGTTAIGLERRVVILPNGQARLEIAAPRSP